jgi:HK97 gp10 family phage protein
VKSTAHVEGGAALARKLKALGPKIAKKVCRKALRAGAKIILQEAKNRVPVRTGKLKKSLKVRAQKRKRKDSIGVTVQTNDGNFTGETYYGGPVEFGFEQVPAVMGRDGKFYSKPRGTQPTVKREGKRFMQGAFDAKKDTAVRAIARETGDGIERVAKE